jgi:hypothetical protein
MITPDDKPITGLGIVISGQKINVNNEPIRGDQVASLRTDDTGMATATLAPGSYGIWPDIPGYQWNAVNFNVKVETGKRATVTLVPSRWIIVIRRADDSLITNSLIHISKQKLDANGKSIRDQEISYSRTQDTGEAVFGLTPGTYAINMDDVHGEDWGMLDNVLPPATQLTYNMRLGRINLESRDTNGNVISGYYARVCFQTKNVNGQAITGNCIQETRTDNTGLAIYDLSEGTYVMESNDGAILNIAVKSGQIITLKNTDFKKQ